MNAPLQQAQTQAQAQAHAPALKLATGDGLAAALRHGGIGEFQAQSDFAACLMPLLHALGWRGDTRQIAEALPHFSSSLKLPDFENVLARLGFVIRSVKAAAARIDPRLLPCLLVRADGSPVLLLAREGSCYQIYDPAIRSTREEAAEALSGAFHFIRHAEHSEQEEKERKENWVRALFARFKPLIWQLFLLTFVLNCISLAVPFFTRALYDQVIPMRATGVLAYLFAGVLMAFGVEFALRLIRARLVAYLGGRVENIVATATFGQILSLPTPQSQGAPLGTQVSRLKEFDSMRDLFMGPLVSVLLEIPFVFLFLGVIALVAGPLALIPVIMIALFALIAFLVLPALKRTVFRASRAKAQRHSFLVEMIRQMRTIKESGAEGIWSERNRAISAEAAYTHFHQAQLNHLLQTLAQSVMFAAGAATIAWGVVRVVDGAMSVGALIATMALVWRVLAPIQQLFLTFSRFEQIQVSIRQINQLMRMPPEEGADMSAGAQGVRRFHGDLNFQRVSFRYTPTSEPALLGVNASIRKGELVAVLGANGAGKSTLLVMVAGLLRPQAGQICIDGLDIRQIAPLELRQQIGYLPQRISLFHGTVAQNLRLANPAASDEDLREACRMANVLSDVESLPEGFETRIGDGSRHHLNSGLTQRIGLARVFVKKAPVLLLDEPAQNLDEAGDARFIETLKILKGQSTILMVSHRPSHVRLADWAMVMENGMLSFAGKPEDVLSRLYGGKK